MRSVDVIRKGNPGRKNPFTIFIVANPYLEAPSGSGTFIPDPIVANQSAFINSIRYVDDCLFCKLPNQVENVLADPSIENEICIVSFFDDALPVDDKYCLVSETSVGITIEPRRVPIKNFLDEVGCAADIVYAVSASPRRTVSSAWFTSDDDARGGTPFTLDSRTLFHRWYNLIPGTVALHATADSLTALHEFSHAISSYSNGKVVDIYSDGNPAVNAKRPQPPVPLDFASYNARKFSCDRNRVYPNGWHSYHCERNGSAYPALMDNYYSAPVPNGCSHDLITRQFISDRVKAKIARQ